MAITLDLMPVEEKLPEAPAPKTMVVRYGYLLEIGEFHSDVMTKVGCGTKLVVRTDRGTEIAEMLTTTCGNGGCSKSITREKMLEYIGASGGRDYPFTEQGRILRVATAQDLAEQAKLDEHRREHVALARDHVARHQLSMKIVEVEYLLGGERVLFYFTSEQRIDFRGLVRDLAQELHTRIEMRQVGARDDARLTADYEKCGQHCCCKQFLKVLTPVSMRSAKVQKATLDPTKISGRCGRLMCCLRYEDQTYEELRKKLPKRNTRVKTEKGDGWVVDGQILTQLVMVMYDDGKREAVPMEKIVAFDQPKPTLPDGRTMQSPNDRPPPPREGDSPRGPRGAGPGGPRGPGGQGAPRGPGGPAMTRDAGAAAGVPPAAAGPAAGVAGVTGVPEGPGAASGGAAPVGLRPMGAGQGQGPRPGVRPPQMPGQRPLGPGAGEAGGPPYKIRPLGGPKAPRPMPARPMPGAPAAGPAGDPLAKSGPTGGDLNTGDDLADLIADAMDDSPPVPRQARPAGGQRGFQPPPQVQRVVMPEATMSPPPPMTSGTEAKAAEGASPPAAAPESEPKPEEPPAPQTGA